MPVSLGNNRASFTWGNLFQSDFGTIVPSSFEKYRASLIWKQSCQSHLGITVPVLQGNDFTSVTSEQWRGCHLGTIVPTSLGSIVSVAFGIYRGIVLWIQLCQFYFRTILLVQFEKKFKLI